MPNVKVEDMGHKMGLNGVDNAKITFDNVRVPRDNLLNRYSDVDDEGNFVSEIGSGRARFLAVADQLLSGTKRPVNGKKFFRSFKKSNDS